MGKRSTTLKNTVELTEGSLKSSIEQKLSALPFSYKKLILDSVSGPDYGIGLVSRVKDVVNLILLLSNKTRTYK